MLNATLYSNSVGTGGGEQKTNQDQNANNQVQNKKRRQQLGADQALAQAQGLGQKPKRRTFQNAFPVENRGPQINAQGLPASSETPPNEFTERGSLRHRNAPLTQYENGNEEPSMPVFPQSSTENNSSLVSGVLTTNAHFNRAAKNRILKVKTADPTKTKGKHPPHLHHHQLYANSNGNKLQQKQYSRGEDRRGQTGQRIYTMDPLQIRSPNTSFTPNTTLDKRGGTRQSLQNSQVYNAGQEIVMAAPGAQINQNRQKLHTRGPSVLRQKDNDETFPLVGSDDFLKEQIRTQQNWFSSHQVDQAVNNGEGLQGGVAGSLQQPIDPQLSQQESVPFDASQVQKQDNQSQSVNKRSELFSEDHFSHPNYEHFKMPAFSKERHEQLFESQHAKLQEQIKVFEDKKQFSSQSKMSRCANQRNQLLSSVSPQRSSAAGGWGHNVVGGSGVDADQKEQNNINISDYKINLNFNDSPEIPPSTSKLGKNQTNTSSMNSVNVQQVYQMNNATSQNDNNAQVAYDEHDRLMTIEVQQQSHRAIQGGQVILEQNSAEKKTPVKDYLIDNALQKVSREVRDHILMGSDDDTSGIVDDDDDDMHPLDRDSRVDPETNINNLNSHKQGQLTNAASVVTKVGEAGGNESISININDQVQRVYTDYAENFVEFDSERAGNSKETATGGERGQKVNVQQTQIPQRISKSGGLRQRYVGANANANNMMIYQSLNSRLLPNRQNLRSTHDQPPHNQSSNQDLRVVSTEQENAQNQQYPLRLPPVESPLIGQQNRPIIQNQQHQENLPMGILKQKDRARRYDSNHQVATSITQSIGSNGGRGGQIITQQPEMQQQNSQEPFLIHKREISQNSKIQDIRRNHNEALINKLKANKFISERQSYAGSLVGMNEMQQSMKQSSMGRLPQKQAHNQGHNVENRFRREENGVKQQNLLKRQHGPSKEKQKIQRASLTHDDVEFQIIKKPSGVTYVIFDEHQAKAAKLSQRKQRSVERRISPLRQSQKNQKYGSMGQFSTVNPNTILNQYSSKSSAMENHQFDQKLASISARKSQDQQFQPRNSKEAKNARMSLEVRQMKQMP